MPAIKHNIVASPKVEYYGCVRLLEIPIKETK